FRLIWGKWLKLVAERRRQLAIGGIAHWTTPDLFGSSRPMTSTASDFAIISVSLPVKEANYFVAATAFYVKRIIEFLSIQNPIAMYSPNVTSARATKSVRIKAGISRKIHLRALNASNVE